MKTKKKKTLKFYQNLGRLFYAVASSDNKVHPLEFDKLKEIVKMHWVPLDPIMDEFDTDAAYQIEIVFDWLNNEEHVNANRCFEAFLDYKNDQEHLFTKPVKKLILKTASAIANAFAGINKSELIMLAKLELELKK